MAAVTRAPVSTTEPLLDLAHSIAAAAPKGFIDTILKSASRAALQNALETHPSQFQSAHNPPHA